MRRSDEEAHAAHQRVAIERVQVGARMEKRMVKVLKALAEYLDLSLGDLLEGIVLHAFESQLPFDEDTLKRVAQLKQVYGMEYGAEASHHFVERPTPRSQATASAQSQKPAK